MCASIQKLLFKCLEKELFHHPVGVACGTLLYGVLSSLSAWMTSGGEDVPWLPEMAEKYKVLHGTSGSRGGETGFLPVGDSAPSRGAAS